MLLQNRCKIHEGVTDAKAENDACVNMMLPLVVVGCTSKQSVSQCEATTPPAWIMQPHRQTPLNWIIFTSERLITKTTEGTQKYINEQCR